MSVEGRVLEVKVVDCKDLKNTKWISKQDPYVILDYAGNKHRTKTDTDGGRNPIFDEEFMFSLIDGLKEINVSVWTNGYHYAAWPLTRRKRKRAGDITFTLKYSGHKEVQKVSAPEHHSPPAHHRSPAYAAPRSPPDNVCYPPVIAPYPPTEQTAYPRGASRASGAFEMQFPYHPQPLVAMVPLLQEIIILHNEMVRLWRWNVSVVWTALPWGRDHLISLFW
ncbi:hypothetical protein L7F22_067648 [Adiantum nelumboides]|nr:hypothetical protein [Adiantum nelumboides]